MPSPAELAISVGRGLRSAVGTYGFAEGGLIVERGKLPGERIAPLDVRLALPDHWRFALIHPRDGRGLWGEVEQRAFDHLPAVPGEVTDELTGEVRQRMLAAVASGQFELFSESVYRYGRIAGMCFAEIQGGPYNGPRLTELVEQVRSMGVTGVGQSSWGPTLFAILPDQTAAEDLVASFAKRIPDEDIELSITRASSQGATIARRRAP
jgi:predicted sugar kinase